ncbi:hypothetical protein AB0878_47255 [Amycolatopsis sp. NPDC047767]|uniref:hypothetical protein n=1 Tax=Amycolatopsis sp. NPDC047767 TaxID=3156765 RepID=UPI003453148A
MREGLACRVIDVAGIGVVQEGHVAVVEANAQGARGGEPTYSSTPSAARPWRWNVQRSKE